MYINQHYLNKYNKFIKNCSLISHKSYIDTEMHHIIPKSFGGSDDTNNLIKLTYRQHFIAHILLAKAYPFSNIGNAIYYFIYGGKQNTIIKTSRIFEFAKRAAGVINSSWFNDGNNNYRLPIKIGGDLGFTKGRTSTDIWKNKICINDGIKNKIISIDQVDQYLKKGYQKGMIKRNKIIHITNGDKNSAIDINLLDEFLNNNKQWFKGITVKSKLRIKGNCIRMHIDDTEQNIPIDQIDGHIDQGWSIGRSDNSKLSCANAKNQIYLDNENKRVSDDELPIYLSIGWKLGLPQGRKDGNKLKVLGRKIVYDPATGSERKLKPDEVDNYLSIGFVKGRNPITITKISSAMRSENI